MGSTPLPALSGETDQSPAVVTELTWDAVFAQAKHRLGAQPPMFKQPPTTSVNAGITNEQCVALSVIFGDSWRYPTTWSPCTVRDRLRKNILRGGSPTSTRMDVVNAMREIGMPEGVFAVGAFTAPNGMYTRIHVRLTFKPTKMVLKFRSGAQAKRFLYSLAHVHASNMVSTVVDA